MHRLSKLHAAVKIAEKDDTVLFATPQCGRQAQYERGCVWDRCCKKGFLTACREHEDWCNKHHEEQVALILEEAAESNYSPRK